jgi:transcriptional regulator with XRE-family HTH domain
MMSTETEAFASRIFMQDACSVDSHVGDRIRRLRSLSGLGINELAELIGVSVLRMQHYEFGESRLSAEHLRRVCGALNVPPSFFFESRTIRAAAKIATIRSPVEHPTVLRQSREFPSDPADQAVLPTAEAMARSRSLSK